jgi:hypothetical protein
MLSTFRCGGPLSGAGMQRYANWWLPACSSLSQLTIDGTLMKKLIAVLIAGLFGVAGAFADEMKKDEKKADAKPAAEAKKDVTPAADAKKDAKPAADVKKADAKKADAKKADAKKDEPKKEEAKK